MISNLSPHSKTNIQRTNLSNNFSKNLSRNIALSTALAASLAGCPPVRENYITPKQTDYPITPTPIPSPTPILNTVKLTEFTPPTYEIQKIIYYGSSLFALSLHGLHKSSDSGESWKKIPINLLEATGSSETKAKIIDVEKNGLYSFDIDKDKIWIASRDGVIVSENLDGNFSWSNYSDDSTPRSIDMVNGYGWFVNSGRLRKKTPDKKEWTPVSTSPGWNFGSIITDPSDPANIAYFFTGIWMMTIDGGKTWNNFSLPADLLGKGYGLNIIGNDKTFIFSGPQYSDDHFKTWKPLGITAAFVINIGTEFYTFGTSTGQKDSKKHFFTGTPNNWIDRGSVDLDFLYRTATNSMFFGYTTNGKFYRGTWE